MSSKVSVDEDKVIVTVLNKNKKKVIKRFIFYGICHGRCWNSYSLGEDRIQVFDQLQEQGIIEYDVDWYYYISGEDDDDARSWIWTKG